MTDDRMIHTTAIPFDVFNKQGRPIYFLHANGYPPRAYQLLFSSLPEYTVHAPLLRPFWTPFPAV